MRYGFLLFIILFIHSTVIFSQNNPWNKNGFEIEHELVFVPGGHFEMGDLFFEYNFDALPVHTVYLEDFYISKYPVTYQEYDLFARIKKLRLPEDNRRGRGRRAVVNITWDEAVKFCKSLGYRLPTEREWEYAARSGGENELFSGTNNRDSLNYYAHYEFNSHPVSQPVGIKKPNGLGIYDMSGNVFEWIGDWYYTYQIDPKEIEYYPIQKKDFRVIRGGSVLHPPLPIRTYWRAYTFRDSRGRDIGFRCAVTAPTQGIRQ